jgi:hypothetical protein
MMRWSNWGAFAFAVLVAVGSYFLLRGNWAPKEDESLAVGGAAAHPVTVVALSRQDDGSLASLTSPLMANTDVVFQLDTTRPIHVSLALSADGGAPTVVLSDARVPAGPARLITRGTQAFVYRANSTEGSLRICAVYADDTPELMRRVERLRADWPNLATCMQLR